MSHTDPTGSPDVRARRKVVRDALAVAVATGAYGISYGAIGVTGGLTVAQTCALSLLMFTGGSQFALVGVVGAGGSPLSAVSTALLLGARNTFYGVRLATLLRLRGIRRLVGAHGVIDETTAMAIGRSDPRLARLAFWTTAATLFALWNVGTLVGALAGAELGNPEAYGLDAAAPAAFVALLWPRLTAGRTRAIAVAGVVVALALVPFTPAGIPVLAAGGAAVLAGALEGRTTRGSAQQDGADAS